MSDMGIVKVRKGVTIKIMGKTRFSKLRPKASRNSESLII